MAFLNGYSLEYASVAHAVHTGCSIQY